MGSSLCFCVICYDVETATIYQLHRELLKELHEVRESLQHVIRA